MNKITGLTDAFVTMYVGGPTGLPPPVESGWVVYDVNNSNNLKHIAILSEVDWGSPSLCYTVLDSVTEEAWLNMGPAYGQPGDIQPLKVDAIDNNTGTVTCTADTANVIIGGLSTGTVLYTVNMQGNVDKVGFANPADQGTVKLLMNISDVITEAGWLAINSAGVKVSSIVI